MSKTGRFFLLILCAVSLVGSDAIAQSRAGDPFRFSIGTGVSVTDNRDNASRDEETNVEFFVAPRIDVVVSGRRVVLDFFAVPTFALWVNPADNQNDFELYGDLGFDFQLTLLRRLRLMFLEQFRSSWDPEVEDGALVRRDSSYFLNRVESGVNVGITRRLNLDLRGRHGIRWYTEDAVADESNEQSLGATGAVFWQFLRTLGVLAQIDGVLFDYERGNWNVQRDIAILSAALGLEASLGTSLRAALRGGYKVLSYADNTINEDAAPYVVLVFNGEITPAVRLKVDARYELKNPDDYPFASQHYAGAGGKFEWDILRWFGVFISGGCHLAHYETDTVPANFVAQEAGDAAWNAYVAREGINVRADGDKVVLYGGTGAALRIGSHFTISGSFQHQNVESDVSEDFTKNMGTLSCSVRF